MNLSLLLETILEYVGGCCWYAVALALSIKPNQTVVFVDVTFSFQNPYTHVQAFFLLQGQATCQCKFATGVSVGDNVV